MYKIKDTVYSDPGKMLVGARKQGYQFKGEMSEFREEDVNLDAMVLHDGYAQCPGLIVHCPDPTNYARLKASLVKGRYSYDDQIAIMLNKDDDAESLQNYERMQAWRTWCALVAKKIQSLAE